MYLKSKGLRFTTENYVTGKRGSIAGDIFRQRRRYTSQISRGFCLVLNSVTCVVTFIFEEFRVLFTDYIRKTFL